MGVEHTLLRDLLADAVWPCGREHEKNASTTKQIL